MSLTIDEYQLLDNIIKEAREINKDETAVHRYMLDFRKYEELIQRLEEELPKNVELLKQKAMKRRDAEQELKAIRQKLASYDNVLEPLASVNLKRSSKRARVLFLS